VGGLVTNNREKTEVFNNFFASFFDSNLSFQIYQAPEHQDRDWGNEVPSMTREDKVQDRLRNLNIQKSIRPNEMHPTVLREFTGVVASHSQ